MPDLAEIYRQILAVGWQELQALRAHDWKLVEILVRKRQPWIDQAEQILFEGGPIADRPTVMALLADIQSQEAELERLTREHQRDLLSRMQRNLRFSQAMSGYREDLVAEPGAQFVLDHI